jgi:repressor LexA
MFLTKRQSQLLEFLRKSIAEQGYAPSLEEMARHFGLSSVGTVHKHLKALEEKGYVRRQWNRSRAIEIVDVPDGKARRIPLLGHFELGGPIEATTEARSVAIPEDLLDRGRAFVLQARGSALRDACIDDGDLLVVEQREKANDGETVVVSVPGQGTVLARFYREGERVRLESRSNSRPAMSLPADQCRLQGIVRGVIRRYPD